MNLAEAKIHFVGIGGIGMSGIAEVLVNMGCRVTGSDLSTNAQVERLQAMGVEIAKGHKGANLPSDCDVVVYSSAVVPSNPEIKEAKKRKVPVVQRAEMLSELMGLKRGIAIAGTHGKTTTTSMTATVLLGAGLDPTIVIGGRLDILKSTAALGKGEWMLAEADESDGSFLKLCPEIAVITNIDNDHLDHYENFDHLKRAFGEFAREVPFYGCAVFCADDPAVAKLARGFDKRQITYGFHKSARLRCVDLKTFEGTQSFSAVLDGKNLGEIQLQVAGRHNVQNSLAAVAVGLELKIPFSRIAGSLQEFRGVDRRLQKKGESNGVIVVDDYGHHPTEVKATLAALRQNYPHRRLVVAFQPHRYTRTKICWKQFMTCFKDADVVGILDIYSAGERKIKGIDSKKLASAAAKKQKGVSYLGPARSASGKVRTLLKSGDVFLTLGAGDVWKIGQELVNSP